jgi:large subunit ribosomal protein L4
MQADVKNLKGETVNSVELPADIFEAPINIDLMHQAYQRQMANARLGTHSTKSRGEVSGGGKKPWKQKGTGRARQGSIRASHWVGGGKAMGPKPRDYFYRPPKKVRRGALRAALSLRAAEKTLIILDGFKLDAAKSKQAFDVLTKRLKLQDALVIDVKDNSNLHRSVRNLAKFDVLPPEGLNLESVLRHKHLVITSAAAKAIEGALS